MNQIEQRAARAREERNANAETIVRWVVGIVILAIWLASTSWQ